MEMEAEKEKDLPKRRLEKLMTKGKQKGCSIIISPRIFC